MLTEREGNRYLVILTLGDASRERLAILVPSLTGILKNISTEPIEQAFRAANADVFGYFLRSKLPARQLIAQIQSPSRTEPFLSNSDSLLIVQIGQDFGAFGGSKAWTWLQPH
jgi:hypothetical protein